MNPKWSEGSLSMLQELNGHFILRRLTGLSEGGSKQHINWGTKARSISINVGSILHRTPLFNMMGKTKKIKEGEVCKVFFSKDARGEKRWFYTCFITYRIGDMLLTSMEMS